MFAIVEKNGEKMAVHSAGDLKYLQARGWQLPKPETIKPPVETLHLPKKRGRPFKKD